MMQTCKQRIELAGLVLSLIGLAAILQPYFISIYTGGFYALFLGSAVYFLGGSIPEQQQFNRRVFIQVAVLFAVVITVMLLAVYLAPLLLSI